MIAVGGVLALIGGCKPAQMVKYPLPPGTVDPGPTIVVTTIADNGVVEAGKDAVSADATISLKPQGSVQVIVNATDAVTGMANLHVTFTKSNLLQVDAPFGGDAQAGVNRATGLVPATLVVAGPTVATGSAPVPFTFSVDHDAIVRLLATATSVGGKVKTIHVTYQATNIGVLHPDSTGPGR